MTITITTFERSPDGRKGLARDTRVRWALEEVGQPFTFNPVTLPTLPSFSLLNGVAANGGTIAVAFEAAGSEQAIISSGGSPFGSPITMFYRNQR
jgi:hypothetical protein